MGKKMVNQSTPIAGNDGILYTRNIILRSICVIYLCAFLTFYYQSPGLFGKNGISPAFHQFKDPSSEGAITAIHKKPTLLHFASYIGLDTDYMMDLLALLGVIISFTGFISQTFCLLPTFAALWSLYYSLVQITQSFVNQSDYLLLEAGFLCLILAPISTTKKSAIADKIGLTMLKWLLFRFMFDSGAVKFFTSCPHWWNFNGLIYHMETLPLPTSLSWYFHHVPKGYLKISAIFTHMSELMCTWFFFFPNRNVRIFIFYWIMYLQLCIVVTGNFGILNYLIMILLFTLLDDKYFKRLSIFDILLRIIMYSIAYTVGLFVGYLVLDSYMDKLAFKFDDLQILRTMTSFSPCLALVSVIVNFLNNLISYANIKSSKTLIKKIYDINILLGFTLCSLGLIGISVVPHYNIDPAMNISNTQLGSYYRGLNKYNIVNQYGQHLKRARTERFEITLEYAQHIEGPWEELSFIYKPWTLNETLPYAGAYLPRLDMKFYEAATVNYREQLWIVSLAYRILQNEPTVLRLLGIEQKLLHQPKYVRGILNKFKYTAFSQHDRPAYWTRKILGEHFPALSLDNPALLSYLKTLKFGTKKKPIQVDNKVLIVILQFIRKQVELIEGSILIWGMLIAGLLIIVTKKMN